MKKYREELYRKTVYCPTCRGVTPQGCQRRGALCGLRGHGGGGPAGRGGTDVNEKKPSPFRGWAMASADIGIAALSG